MRRLYLQIYLAFVAIIFVFAAVAATVWHLRDPRPEDQQMLSRYGATALVADGPATGLSSN